MKAQDLRERSTEELRDLDKSLSNALFHYRFRNFTGRLDDTSLVKKTRRDIAKVRAILAERERAASTEAR